MRTFIGAVLGVIAVGVLLIAYGLLSPRAAAAPGDVYQLARPTNGLAQPVALSDDLSTAATPQLQVRCEPGQRAIIRQVNGSSVGACVDGVTEAAYGERRVATAYRVSDVRPVRTFNPAPRRSVSIERPHRDWAKTAMVIGGTTAAGAGLGAIFGGKKGALIGAAIGGGAGTLYEVRKR